MKSKIKKFLALLPPSLRRPLKMIFEDAAENHLFIIGSGQKRFRSYTELKRHQKRVRAMVLVFCLAAISLFVGIMVGPALFSVPMDPEVYIPNGKGDIVLGNISKNQVTVIFKTLDSANGNKPLATRATVEVYEDPNYVNLERRTNEDDYAVTHIVPVDSLQEGKTYYIRIIARDAAIPVHEKTVSSWGGVSNPITFFTAGDLVANCQPSNDGKKVSALNNIDDDIDTPEVKLAENGVEEMKNISDDAGIKKSNSLSLIIDDVQNENYLQPDNKVQTIISWKTNVPASTKITYGEQGSGERKEFTGSDQISTKHAVVMTTLKTSTVYYFTVTSNDSKGNTVTSEEYSLRTPRAQQNIVQKISDNFKQLIEQIKPSKK